MSPARRLRRAVPAAGIAVAAVAAALAAWTAHLLRYRGEGPARADAVVLLAGADDGRDRLARDLVAAGYAGTLVVSDPGGRFDRVVERLTAGPLRPGGAEILRFRPEPRTTWGEATALGAIARDRGWRRVVVVTNRPHARRTATWMRSATGLDVRITPIGRIAWRDLPRHVVWEAAGFVKGRLRGHW